MRRLACFDLDNTLIDRNGAFLRWARWWVETQRLDETALEWFVAHDNGGFRAREELFGMARDVFGIAAPVDELVTAYNEEHPLFTWVRPEVLDGLGALRAAGWGVAVVTNGDPAQQDLKLEYTQLDKAVDCACVSGAVGVRKPDPRIFELAAERAGATLAGGWMVGDHPAYDIAGGIAAGLRTIRVGNHNAVDTPLPDHHVNTVTAAFDVILAS